MRFGQSKRAQRPIIAKQEDPALREMELMNQFFERVGSSLLGEKRYRAAARCMERLDPRYRASMRRLRAFHKVHRGKRCFVLGNGPSLKRTDLSLLAGEFSFATNRIYLGFDESAFRPSYYVCCNELVVEQCASEIAQLEMPKFIAWHNRELIEYTRDMVFLWTRSGLRSWFYTDLAEGCWEGSTVTMVCLQLAYYMGFSEVVLVGVDHSYQFEGRPHEAVVSQGDDPNHFNANYFGKGFKWHLPDLQGSELSYRVARHMFELDGRRIVDATIGGKLQVFEKVDYYGLFGDERMGRTISAPNSAAA